MRRKRASLLRLAVVIIVGLPLIGGQALASINPDAVISCCCGEHDAHDGCDCASCPASISLAEAHADQGASHPGSRMRSCLGGEPPLDLVAPSVTGESATAFEPGHEPRLGPAPPWSERAPPRVELDRFEPPS